MFRTLRFVFAGGALATGGYLIGSGLKTHESFKGWLPVEDSEEFQYLHTHPKVQQLRKTHRESRYYDMIPFDHRVNYLTSGILKGHRRLTVEPFVFTNEDETEMTFLYHVGDQVSGHRGIVHGGMLATLMDEALSRTAFPALPNKYGVTASLDVQYKAPVPVSSYLILHTKLVEANGRKYEHKAL